MGDKTLEIQPSSIDKGAVAKAILRDLTQSSSYDPNIVNREIDFMLCIANAKSDESIFALLNELQHCITSTVGKRKSKTKAKYCVDGAENVKSILEFLTM